MRIADEVVAEARSWIGTPYRHQASLKGAGADCLGLVRGVWRRLYGSEPEAVPPYAPDWSGSPGDEALWEAALRHLLPVAEPGEGQVLLFRMRDGAAARHLGISAARDRRASFIHAYSGHAVAENALTDAWARRIVARFSFPDRGA
jgi:NlpC/P60 family putative phage cell wall peptidase